MPSIEVDHHHPEHASMELNSSFGDLEVDPFTEGLDKVLGFGATAGDFRILDDLFVSEDLALSDDEDTDLSSKSVHLGVREDYTSHEDSQIPNEQDACQAVELPKKPKRSLSAYNLFFQAERKNLLEKLPLKGPKPRRSHGKCGFAEMARTIAGKWKAISPEDKKEFERLSALDGERYAKEMAEWRQLANVAEVNNMKRSQNNGRASMSKGDDADLSLGIEGFVLEALLEDSSVLDPLPLLGPLPSQKKQTKKKKTKKTTKKKKKDTKKDDPNAIKKPTRCLSAYNLFFQQERKRLLAALPAREGQKPRRSHGKCGFAEMARTIASRWRSISADEKMEYERLSAIDGERYDREMAEYRKLVDEQAAAAAASAASDTSKTTADSDAATSTESADDCIDANPSGIAENQQEGEMAAKDAAVELQSDFESPAMSLDEDEQVNICSV